MTVDPIVECVPNFSEGRDLATIDAVAAAIASTPGATLLDVDSGRATHRTVMTFVGAPEAVEEAAFRAITVARERIDMARHRGVHPRIGATDVCPFVPLRGIDLDGCAELARRLGRRVGGKLSIPVYLYAHAATRPERRRLPAIRRGGYEALETKLVQPDFAPDFGPARFDSRAGATVIGARPLLIAWNLNLDTTDPAVAVRIAASLRETGRVERDAEGRARRVRGRFLGLQASGWTIPEYGRAQVTCNVLDIDSAPLLDVLDACREEAGRHGVHVTGSELVGLVPLAALLSAGAAVLARDGRAGDLDESARIAAAVTALGLSDLRPFDPARKVLEYRYQSVTGRPL